MNRQTARSTRFKTGLAVALLVGCAGTADAQGAKPGSGELLRGPRVRDTGPAAGAERGPKEGQTDRRRRPDRQPTLSAFRAQFDADGDGTLNAEEREALKPELEAYQAELIAPYDTNDNGLLGPEEFKTAAETLGFPLPERRPRPGQDRPERARRGAPDVGEPGMGGSGMGGSGMDEPGMGGPDLGALNDIDDVPLRGQRRGRPGPGDEGARGLIRERIDRDGDGEISPEERERAEKAVSFRLTSMLERLDANADAAISEQEAADAIAKLEQRRARGGANGAPDRPRPSRADLIERFDLDGDGRLSDEERTQARESIRARRQANPET